MNECILAQFLLRHGVEVCEWASCPFVAAVLSAVVPDDPDIAGR